MELITPFVALPSGDHVRVGFIQAVRKVPLVFAVAVDLSNGVTITMPQPDEGAANVAIRDLYAAIVAATAT